MNIARDSIEATLAGVGSKATYTGAGFGFSGWLLSSEFGVLVGIVGVVGGLLLTWFYKRRQDQRDDAREQREEAEHRLRMILRSDSLGHGSDE